MKLIFLVSCRYDQNFHNLNVAPLLDAGLHVEVWDAMAIINPQGAKVSPSVLPPNKCHNRQFSKASELINALQAIPDRHVLVTMIHYSKQTKPIYKAIDKRRAVTLAFHLKACPSPFEDHLESTGFKEQLKQLRKRIGSLNKIQKSISIFPQFPAEWAGIPSTDILVSNSTSPREYTHPTGPKTQVVYAPNRDYDSVVRWKRAGSPTLGIKREGAPLVVFIDNMAPRHPDLVKMSASRQVLTEDGLYPHVVRNLKSIQAQGAEVAIAAHPRATQKGWLDHYADFTVYKGKTLELIAESDLVINLNSAAIAYAVLLRKPTINCVTDEMELGDYAAYAHFQAELLGKTAINITHNDSIEIDQHMTVNEQNYQQYVDEFIAPPGVDTDRTFWETVLPVVIDRLKP